MLKPDATALDNSSNNLTLQDQRGSGTYVTEVGPHDVLLGRGTGPSSNVGNIRFRTAVEGMKPSYVSTQSRKEKNRLLCKTVEAIKAKNGRFLSKLSKGEKQLIGMPHKKDVYKVETDDIAIEKTKQAIRYVHYKKKGPAVKAVIKDSVSKARKTESPFLRNEAHGLQYGVKTTCEENREKRSGSDCHQESLNSNSSAAVPTSDVAIANLFNNSSGGLQSFHVPTSSLSQSPALDQKGALRNLGLPQVSLRQQLLGMSLGNLLSAATASHASMPGGGVNLLTNDHQQQLSRTFGSSDYTSELMMLRFMQANAQAIDRVCHQDSSGSLSPAQVLTLVEKMNRSNHPPLPSTHLPQGHFTHSEL